MDAVVAAAASVGAWILADEVYRGHLALNACVSRGSICLSRFNGWPSRDVRAFHYTVQFYFHLKLQEHQGPLLAKCKC